MEHHPINTLVFHNAQEAEMQVLAKSLNEHKADYLYQVSAAAKPDDLYWTLKNEELPDIVLINLDQGQNPQTSNFAVIKEVRRLYPKGVIIAGSYADHAATIVNSLECGADDYISKQIDLKHFPRELYNIYRRTIARLRQAEDDPKKKAHVVGKTMQSIDATIPNIIDSAIATVFVFGESGTGKEAVADLFRYHLPKGCPFVKVNCGAISPSLFEAEFFGYAKGAFTGAHADRVGFIEQADGGWLFLDEVTTLPKSAQATLLRAIENQEYFRVGDSVGRKVSVRFIAATNEDISHLVHSGGFRLDLWQRLTEKVIALPPLRERPDEMEDIIRHHCQSMRGGPYTITDPTLEILAQLPWNDGNIRQLRNCLRAMTECHAEKVLTPTTIPKHIRSSLVNGARDFSQRRVEATRENSLTLTWPGQSKPQYDELADRLLLTVMEEALNEKPVKSLRQLATDIGVVRTTLSNRLKAIAKSPLGHEGATKNLIGRFIKGPKAQKSEDRI